MLFLLFRTQAKPDFFFFLRLNVGLTLLELSTKVLSNRCDLESFTAAVFTMLS